MRGREIGEIRVSSRGMYIRSTADITPKWKDMRTADIMPNWSDMRNTADIPKLYDIGRPT